MKYPLVPNRKYVSAEETVIKLLHLLCRLGLTIPLDAHGYVHRVQGLMFYIEKDTNNKFYVENQDEWSFRYDS